MSSDAPVLCPECRSSLPSESLGSHLRRVHKYQYFRGLWRSPAAAIDDALNDVVSLQPDAGAWKVVSAAANELHGPRTVLFLAAAFGKALERVSLEERDTVTKAVADLLARSGAGAALAAALASDDSTAAHRLALALIGRMSPPLESMLFQPAQALLLDRRLPSEGQLALAALLLRSVAPDDPRANDFLQTLVGGLGKSRSIDQLRELEHRAGRHPAIDAACARLEERLRLACPRCGVEQRRPEMIRHLWEVHRLVLSGRRVRDPKDVIDDWIDAYLARPDPELLERCRALAERLDPEHGVLEACRLFLRRGIADVDAQAALIQDAQDAHASLCPSCFAKVPQPRDVAPSPIFQRGGRLSSYGYTVEVGEKGLFIHVEARSPSFLVFRGFDPERQLTLRGAIFFLAGPFVLLALFASLFLKSDIVLTGTGILLALALAGYGIALAIWRTGPPLAARVRSYAWKILAPWLHSRGIDASDAAFLAGLADASIGDGLGRYRNTLLPTLLLRTERAVVKGQAPPSVIAPLLRLAIEDAAAGGDPIPGVARHLARCFEGKLPFAVVERLLADWHADWWTEGNQARLRVLLCDRAFAAGFEVRNLLDAGATSPALAELLGVSDPHGLAALRLLWSMRATRPWDRCGEAETVFEVAEDVTSSSLLEQYSDLLLLQEERRWLLAAEGSNDKMGPAQIIVDTGGVRLQGIDFVTTPREVEVRGKFTADELLLDDHLFRGPQPLDELAVRMERWFRFAFHEFLPLTRAAAHWKSPDRAALLRAWGAVTCRDCGAQLLPRVGEVGLAVDEVVGPPASHERPGATGRPTPG